MKNNKITPFLKLPTHERFVIGDAKVHFENKDMESVDREINELANFLISANEREIKFEKQSKIPVFLAVVSIILNVACAFWKF
ncbi:hypothetical protein [Sporosarcina sp. FSL K6-1508]|uniref:hypothetical protein n=1 Tax=Sporosarcina sp. FSL K6-1508 TaxID=2921553 RepID=UPI0030F536ED